MKTWIAAATGIILLAGGVAVAQTAASPAAPPPPGAQAGGPPGPGGPAGPGGPEGWRRGPPPFMEHGPMGRGMEHGPMGRDMEHGPMGRGMQPPPPTKAAVFHFRRGDARIDIKCADDEPTKACVDAATVLMDKLAAQPNQPR